MNGEVEEIKNSTYNEMTPARAMWDECEPELLSALEPNSVRASEQGKQSRDDDTNKEERLQKQTSKAVGSIHSHQAMRCKRMPCGSSWWFMMCSCRARSQSCCQLGRPRGVFVYLSGGQLKPTDRGWRPGRSARRRDEREKTCPWHFL